MKPGNGGSNLYRYACRRQALILKDSLRSATPRPTVWNQTVSNVEPVTLPMQRRKIPLDFLSGGGDIALDGGGFAAAPAPKSLERISAQLLYVFRAADDADAVAGRIRTG